MHIILDDGFECDIHVDCGITTFLSGNCVVSMTSDQTEAFTDALYNLRSMVIQPQADPILIRKLFPERY